MRGTAPRAEPGEHAVLSWRRSSFAMSLASGLLLWAALPPLGWWPLGWVAPVFWLMLVRVERLPGKRPYVGVWLAAALHWLAVMQGIRLAHWALYFGWVALACYLAVYLALFVALTRVAVHRWKAPLLVAAPVVWTGLELARGHVITGFSMALLGHTQVRWTSLLQLCDALGAYGVTFLLMLAAASFTQLLPLPETRDSKSRRWSVWPLLPAAAAVGLALLYGQRRLNERTTAPSNDATTHVALIQGSIDTVFDVGPERYHETFLQYHELSLRARAERPDLDLIVWPESMFAATELLFEGRIEPPSGLDVDPQQFRDAALACISDFQNRTRLIADSINSPAKDKSERLDIPALVGTETRVFYPDEWRSYNSALLIDANGEIVGRYSKMHPVMFGEYIPFGRLAPWLYSLTPMSGGLTPGQSPQVFDIGGLRMSPSICFESTVPHLIRRQVAELARRGASPDVLVNITNDGWFWGSSILDLHLYCSVFRAIENRRPVLIAANTGFSAWIDGNGMVKQAGPRRACGIIYADVRPDGRGGLYQMFGDLPAGICLVFCLALAVSGLTSRFRPPPRWA